MTNLDSVLKNKDITLLTKVCIVKAVVFSSTHVQMCGGISLAIQCLRLHASIAGYIGLIPDQGTKIPRATWSGQKQKSVEKD